MPLVTKMLRMRVLARDCIGWLMGRQAAKCEVLTASEPLFLCPSAGPNSKQEPWQDTLLDGNDD